MGVDKREKVIKGLECHAKAIGCRQHCPYSYWRSETLDCSMELADDALALLKAQEPKYPIRKQSKHGWFPYCPKCEIILNEMARPKYCSNCGQAVKWE